MDKKGKTRERRKTSPDKKITSKRLKSESVKTHRDESPKSSTSTASMPIIVDSFAHEEKLSRNIHSQEIYREFVKGTLSLLKTLSLKDNGARVTKGNKENIGKTFEAECKPHETTKKTREELKSSQEIENMECDNAILEMINTPVWARNMLNLGESTKSSNIQHAISVEEEFIKKSLQHYHNIKEALKKPSSENLISSQNATKLQEEWNFEIFEMVSHLKRLNRLDKHRLKYSRERVAEGKQKLDEKRLKYQNMLSEIAYLRNEAKGCLEFECEHSKVDLIPVEEFYNEAPPEISNKEITENDSHELTLARLTWELEKRKLLAEELKQTEDKKKQIRAKVKDLMDCLYNVEPMLKKIQEAVLTPYERISAPAAQVYYSRYADAQFLPLPLRNIYLQLLSYAKYWNNQELKIDAIIIHTDISRSAIRRSTAEYSHNLNEIDLFDAKKDVSDSESSREFKGRNNKSSIQEHDLSVQWTMKYEGSELVLIFSYVISLSFVKVRMEKIVPDLSLSIPPSKLLAIDGFLDNLFLGDNGLTNPNPFTQPLHSDLGIVDLCSIFHDSCGKPYMWAQKFAGLDFNSATDPSFNDCVDDTLWIEHAKYVNEIISALKSRMKSRISLSYQVGILALKNKPPSTVISILPTNIASRLKFIKDACSSEISAHPDYQNLKQEKMFTNNCFFYKLEIERGSALLYSLVIVPPDYPSNAPVFLLFLYWKGSFNNTNNIEIKELEQEVNVYFINDIPEEHKYYTLLCQVYHLRACFDIYLETHRTNDVVEGPKEFAKDKTSIGMFRGRTHSRPYKYVPSLKLFTMR